MLKFFKSKEQVYKIVIAVLAVSFVLELIFPNEHPYYPWHALPGADIVIGFFSCVALIRLAKLRIGPLIQKDENYFGDGGENFDD